MQHSATFRFTADPERLAVAVGEIARASGLGVSSTSQADGVTTLVVETGDPWPPERLDAAGQVLSFFVEGLERVG